MWRGRKLRNIPTTQAQEVTQWILLVIEWCREGKPLDASPPSCGEETQIEARGYIFSAQYIHHVNELEGGKSVPPPLRKRIEKSASILHRQWFYFYVNTVFYARFTIRGWHALILRMHLRFLILCPHTVFSVRCTIHGFSLLNFVDASFPFSNSMSIHSFSLLALRLICSHLNSV